MGGVDIEQAGSRRGSAARTQPVTLDAPGEYPAKRKYSQDNSESLNCLAETRQRAGGPVMWTKAQMGL